MNAANPYAQYQAIRIQTAGPDQLVLLLYDGAARHLTRARAASLAGRPAEMRDAVGRTQEIIEELVASLDFQAGDLARHLFSLYEYWNFRLLTAGQKGELAAVDEVLGLMKELRAAWETVMQAQRPAERSSPAGGEAKGATVHGSTG